MAPFSMIGKKPKVSILTSDSGNGDPFYLEKYINSTYAATPTAPRKISDPSRPRKDSGEFEPFYLEKYVPVMERKIGSRGLSSSFSSNVGRKECAPSSTPPQFLSEEETRSKVKAIVNWLENTNDEIVNSRERSRSTSQSHLNLLRTMGRHKASSAPAKSIPSSLSRFEAELLPEEVIAEEPDEVDSSFNPPTIPTLSDKSVSNGPFSHSREARYSYNFLTHRQFFDNRPLMRCLDEETESNSPEGFPLRTSQATTSPADDLKEIDAASDMNVELSAHAKCNAREEQGGKPEVHIRNAEDVRQYWENVRIELRMRDCEENGTEKIGNSGWRKALYPSTHMEKQGDSVVLEDNHSVEGSGRYGRSDTQSSDLKEIVRHSCQTGKGENNLFRKEDGPSIPMAPIGSRPGIHHIKTLDEQIADFDEFLENDKIWAKSQQKTDEMSPYHTDMYLDLLPLTRKMAAFDGFLDQWEGPDTVISDATQDEVMARHDSIKENGELEKHEKRNLSDDSVQIRDFAQND